MHEIRRVELKDIEDLSRIFVESFNSISPETPWDHGHAFAYLSYWLKKQPDMFWGAFVDGKPVGGFAVNIKPWRTGVRCSDGAIFVDPRFQAQGIGRELFKKIISKAMSDYGAEYFEGVTFATKDFPMSWYAKIGIKEDENVVFIKGKCSDILEKLN